MRRIILFIIVSILLVACGTKDNSVNTKDDTNNLSENENLKENQVNQNKEPSGYAFEHKGVTIYMNTDVEPVLNELGEHLHYFEAESCAFRGLDKTYTYMGFEITTYPLDGKDFILAIDLKDDTVSTPEGIYLGSTVDEMIATYGQAHEESSGSYTYVKDDSKLQFITMNDEIIGITYLALVDGLE